MCTLRIVLQWFLPTNESYAVLIYALHAHARVDVPALYYYAMFNYVMRT